MHTLLLGIDLTLLAIFLVTGLTKTVVVREFHHGYLGDALVLFSFIFGGILLALIGFALRLDDTYEHVQQSIGGKPTFESPLHKLYGKYLYPIPLVRKLQEWLDRKFGKNE